MTQTQQHQTPLILPAIYGPLALRTEQDKAIAPLLKRVRQLFLLRGVPVTAGQRTDMVTYLWRPLQTARSRTYIAAIRYLHGQGIPHPPPLNAYEPPALDKLLQNTVERVLVAGDPVTDANRSSPIVVAQTQKAVARGVVRHAQQPARETVKEAADRSGEEIGWARVLTGARSCHFCAMLAARGPVYRSDKSALFRGGSAVDTYHDGCDCIAVLVRKGIPWDGEDSYRKLDKLWNDTGGNFSGKRARNAFRRTWDQTVRDGGSGDYIADSMSPGGT